MAAAEIRAALERHQVWVYLGAILAGLAVGLARPETAETLSLLLWPLLGTLLYATFSQVPLTRVGAGFRDWRFMTALLTGNFLAIPIAVGGLTAWLPLEPAVRIGILLVLLVPCTDWFISFTHLGRGDAARAIAATPVILIAQLLALPLYLWLFLGGDALGAALSHQLLQAFAGLILLPLLLAWLTERLAVRHPSAARLIPRLGWLPVPLLGLVVFVIAASQVNAVADMAPTLMTVAMLFAAFLPFAAYLGKWLGRCFGVDVAGTRTLAFSFGTRNSFVMLPIALALPEALQIAVVVIVLQSLVELFGMVGYLAWLPKRLIPDVPSS